MLNLQVERLGKGRIWLDEMPDTAYSAALVEERTITAGQTKPLRTRAAVELLVPRGPMAMYGALGVLFSPAGDGPVVVRAGAATPDMPGFKDALPGRLDDVHTGLLAEFVPAVLKGLVAGAESAGLEAGTLTVTHAACGHVGSNAWLFERLARAAVVALTAPAETDWDAALTALLK